MNGLNTIVLKGKGHHDEAPAAAAGILPGMAVEKNASGEVQQPAGTAAATLKTGLRVVKEDALQGKTVDDAYAADATTPFYTPVPGDEIHVLVASGETIAVADFGVITAGGDGTFSKAAGTEAFFPIQFEEASDGALAADTLLVARVL